MYHDYIEKLNNWLELMESETSIDNIFNMVPDREQSEQSTH